MNQPARILVALAAASLLAAPGAAQQLYKYVGPDGRVQYSDRPPPDGQKAEKVAGARVGTVSSGAAAGADAAKADAAKASAPRSAAEMEQDFRKRKLESEDKVRKDENVAEAKRVQDENCANARRQVAGLQAGGRATILNEQGERIFLEDDAVRQQIERLQRDIAAACK